MLLKLLMPGAMEGYILYGWPLLLLKLAVSREKEDWGSPPEVRLGWEPEWMGGRRNRTCKNLKMI